MNYSEACSSASHHLGLATEDDRLSASHKYGLVLFASIGFGCNFKATNIPAQNLLRKHTVYPYSALSLPIDKRDALERALLTGSARGSSVRFGRRSACISTRFPDCATVEQCCFAECQRIGESYWHRQHILPAYSCVLYMETHFASQAFPCCQSCRPRMSSFRRRSREIQSIGLLTATILRELAAAVMEGDAAPDGYVGLYRPTLP